MNVVLLYRFIIIGNLFMWKSCFVSCIDNEHKCSLEVFFGTHLETAVSELWNSMKLRSLSRPRSGPSFFRSVSIFLKT